MWGSSGEPSGPLIRHRQARENYSALLNPEMPLLQVQPIHTSLYGEALNRFEVTPDLDASDWDAYRRTVVVPSADRDRPRGQYAVSSRRRRKRNAVEDTSAAD